MICWVHSAESPAPNNMRNKTLATFGASRCLLIYRANYRSTPSSSPSATTQPLPRSCLGTEVSSPLDGELLCARPRTEWGEGLHRGPGGLISAILQVGKPRHREGGALPRAHVREKPSWGWEPGCLLQAQCAFWTPLCHKPQEALSPPWQSFDVFLHPQTGCGVAAVSSPWSSGPEARLRALSMQEVLLCLGGQVHWLEA